MLPDMSTPLAIERVGTVALVTMQRPEVRNAMNARMLRALLAELRALAGDDSVNVLVVTGAGAAFSGGADLSEELDEDAGRMRTSLFCDLFELVTTYPKPAVAAVAGACVGGGAELAAACDLRVGTPSARIRFPGASLGAPVGAARLPLLVGLSHAKDLLLTARTIDAEEAYRIGFLNRLVAEDELLDGAVALAESIAANGGAEMQKRALEETSILQERVWEESRRMRRSRAGANVPGGGSGSGKRGSRKVSNRQKRRLGPQGEARPKTPLL